MRCVSVCPLLVGFFTVIIAGSAGVERDPQVIELRRTKGSACPYAGAWLASVKLHYQVRYWMESTKMEAATFLISQYANFKYQFLDPDAYYVHHLSMYEHHVHKAQGFAEAKAKTLLLSTAAFAGECGNITVVEGNLSYFAVVPFYGGLPPDVDKDQKVHSLGQGNSLMEPGVKILQTMATVCSLLRHFGQAVIAVAQDSDRALVEETLSTMPSAMVNRTHVLQLYVKRPANLPFHVLAWSQEFLKSENCRLQYPEEDLLACARRTAAPVEHVRGEVNVTYFDVERGRLQRPVSFVYYTESDQLLRIQDTDMLAAMSAASNETSMFFGRRREKANAPLGDPMDYMAPLTEGRSCGSVGWAMTWPGTGDIYAHQSTATG